MANRLKEDEKNEKIIRGLLKLPENRRCINCNSLGPQYVCTNFWTFVCTNCSGIHREFTHRVKSISMAKFTSQEVNSLQDGGNQRAKDIYLKEWDSQRNSLPDSSNIDRLRGFIRHVYVERRYTGERNYDKPPRGKMGEKDELSEKGSSSPSHQEDIYGHRGGRSFDEKRSPENEQEARKFGPYRRSPSEPQIINDWRLEDRFGDGKRFEDRRSSDRDYKSAGQSPERPKDLDSSSPPVVRPVRDILGDNVMPLRLNEPPKTNFGRTTDVSTDSLRTAPSSSTTAGTKEEPKLESQGSLIDFDAESKPPVTATVPQVQPSSMVPPISQSANTDNNNNWASFDFAPTSRAPQVSSNTNTLDTILSQLSLSAPGYDNNLVNQGSSNTLAPPLWGNMQSVSTPGGSSTVLPTIHGIAGMAPNVMQHQQPGNQPVAHHLMQTSAGGSTNQAWNPSFAPVTHSPLAGVVPQSTGVVSQPTSSGIAPQSSGPEVKSSSRPALPEDLFAASYSPFPASVPGWHMGPPHGMVYSMLYNMPAQNVVQPSKSANPFDSSGEAHSVPAPTFPSMSSLQGVFPNLVPPSAGLMRTPGMAPSWMPQQQSPFGSAPPLQVPSHSLVVAPGAYVGQVPSNVSHMGYQGAGGFGTDGSGAAFGPTNPDPMLPGRYQATPAPRSFPSGGGNPFG